MKLVNEINVAVQSANAGERNEFLISFCVHLKSVRTSAHVILYYHRYFVRRPVLMILRGRDIILMILENEVSCFRGLLNPMQSVDNLRTTTSSRSSWLPVT